MSLNFVYVHCNVLEFVDSDVLNKSSITFKAKEKDIHVEKLFEMIEECVKVFNE